MSPRKFRITMNCGGTAQRAARPQNCNNAFSAHNIYKIYWRGSEIKMRQITARQEVSKRIGEIKQKADKRTTPTKSKWASRTIFSLKKFLNTGKMWLNTTVLEQSQNQTMCLLCRHDQYHKECWAMISEQEERTSSSWECLDVLFIFSTTLFKYHSLWSIIY